MPNAPNGIRFANHLARAVDAVRDGGWPTESSEVGDSILWLRWQVERKKSAKPNGISGPNGGTIHSAPHGYRVASISLSYSEFQQDTQVRNR